MNAVKLILSAVEELIRHAKPVLFELSLFVFFLIEIARFFEGVLTK